MLLPGLSRVIGRRLERLMVANKPEQAVRLASRFASLRPGDPGAWRSLGDCLLSEHQFERAEAAMRKGLIRLPGRQDLTFMLGRSLIGQGRFGEAASVFQSARAADPDSFWPYLGMVDLAVTQSDWRTARSFALDVASKIPREWPWAKYELAIRVFPIPEVRPVAVRLVVEARR